MKYPKPLAEKTIQRMYDEIGLSQSRFLCLLIFFNCCAQLYGAAPLWELWNVYKELGNRVMKVRKKDFLQFASVARRDANCGFQVWEAGELFRDVQGTEEDRFVTYHGLIDGSKQSLGMFNQLYYLQGDLNPCVPDNFLTYYSLKLTKEMEQFQNYLAGLYSTSSVLKVDGKEVPNPYMGLKLTEFVNEYISDGEDDDDEDASEARNIFSVSWFMCNIGVPALYDFLVSVLEAAGVDMTAQEKKRLSRHISQMRKTGRLWCQYGWRSDELKAMNGPTDASDPEDEED